MDTEIQLGKPLIEGKTKMIREVIGEPNLVVGEYNDNITAHNNTDLTRQFPGKGRDSNTVNCVMFELLNEAGIPTAFIERTSDKGFLAHKCRMILLEVIARGTITGSYRKRHPDVEEGTKLAMTLIEFFLKTTDGKLVDENGNILIQGLTAEQDDPLITTPFGPKWQLFHPKQPAEVSDSDLGIIDPKSVLACAMQSDSDTISSIMKEMEQITRQVFETLEKAWGTTDHRLIDLKIEFGITADGRLVVTDVIDCDSFRLWRPTADGGWEDVSKQSFRDMPKDDPDGLEKVRAKYAYVAEEALQLIAA